MSDTSPPSLPVDLLDRYFAGTATANEVDRVREAMARHGRLAELRQEVDGRAVDVDRAWDRFASSTWPTDQPATTTIVRSAPLTRLASPAPRRWRTWTSTGVVAAALIALWMRSPAAPDRAAPPGAVYTTALGQRVQVRLADQTIVTLAPGTRLALASGFGRDSRTVTLTGEALFDVAHVGERPLVVRTALGAVRVLGTRFDVKHYVGDTVSRVAVVQGKVQADADGTGAHASMTLTAGMVGIVTDSMARVVTSADADAAAITDWVHGHLDFRNAPVPEALETLERWYGLRFRLADTTLRRETVTGRLDFHSTAAALSYLKTLLGVDMTFDRRGDTAVVILSRAAARSGTRRMADPRPSRAFQLPSEVGR